MLPLVALLLQQGLSLAASTVAQKGADYLKEKTGVDVNINTSSLPPEDLTKIKQAELENESEWREFRLKEMEYDDKQAERALQDLQSARQMQIEALKQDDLFSKRFVYIFITGWSVFSMIFLLCVSFLQIPKDNINTVNTVLGFILGTAIASMFSFLMGTTNRSKQKDDTIHQLSGGQK